MRPTSVEVQYVWVIVFQKILPRRLKSSEGISSIDMKLFGRKEYACATCGAKFDSQDKLTEHGKAHTSPMTVTS